MKKLSLIIAACTLVLTMGRAGTTTEGPVEFYKGSLLSAKEKARSEQKYYFIEFYADWCKPCQWMQENTFNNPKLAGYINDEYIALRVNIEDFDGHALKQKYNVEYLPTIIVFNSEGEVLAKHEKSLSASQMLKILKDHRDNATVEPTTQPVRQVENTSASTPRPSYASYRETGNNESFYSIQVGVYQNATNLFKQVEKLKEMFSEPVQVINQKDAKSDIVTYKIVVGKFNDRSDADQYLTVVKGSGINGFVKSVLPSEVQ